MAFQILFLAVLSMVAGIQAQTENDLRNAVVTGTKLTLKKSIKLTRDLPLIPNGKTVELVGSSGVSIDGLGRFSMFKSPENGTVTLILTNLIITGAVAKGAVAAAVDIRGVLRVTSVDFRSNTRAIQGRAVIATISNSKFSGHRNKTVVVLPGSAVVISGSTFTRNRALSDGRFDGGAAISVFGSYDNFDDRAKVNVSQSTFSSNSAARNLFGGAVYVGTYVVTRFTKCTFKDNSGADRGGAFYTNNADLLIQQSVFEKNQASLGGAIVFRSDGEGNSRILGSRFTANRATVNGGAFVVIHDATPVFCNGVFKDNVAKGVQNNGWCDREGISIGVSPGAVIPLVTVDPGLDPPTFFPPDSCA